MNAIEFKPWMEGAVSEVLESMCFISTEGDATDEDAILQSDWICSCLDFRGEPSGTFGLAVPSATASAIAANFLGDDEAGPNDSQTAEVICELANMVCGSLLAHLDPKRTFDLSSPRPDPTGAQDISDENRISATFTLDEGSIYTWLKIKDPS